MKKLICFLLSVLCVLSIAGCSPKTLPAAEPDLDSQFGVDKNINIENIDTYLGRDDCVYRDMRMLFDPADYAQIGGEADLSSTIKGFKVVPYPYIASLSPLPVGGAYSGDCLYKVVWGENGEIEKIEPQYEESLQVIEELFPKDKNIILTCGGGGYAGMMKAVLIKLGWDESKIYNIGGAWEYKGENKFEIISYPEDADKEPVFATWRADYAYIDFSKLHSLIDNTNVEENQNGEITDEG